jgi:hypothetical protein
VELTDDKSVMARARFKPSHIVTKRNYSPAAFGWCLRSGAKGFRWWR